LGNSTSSADYTFETDQLLNIYYSVGQNTSDHKTGTPTLTISGGVGTFSAAQTAVNLGVGDKVDYGAGLIAYISGKSSTTVWTLITATGTAPEDVSDASVNSISHAFASVSDALANASSTSYLNTDDLLGGKYILNIPCYYDSAPDTSYVSVSGWVTGPENYLKIYAPNNVGSEVNQSQRHSGKWNDAKFSLLRNNVGNYFFTIASNYGSIRRTSD
jgi:hypothetical protein